MRVAVDAMGGDNAPVVEVEGAVAAAREFGISIILVGDCDRVRAELARHNCTGLDITVQHASEVVGMHDSASDAIRKKKDSSIRVAFDLAKDGSADAVVSAGNSGATMAAGICLLYTSRMYSISRQTRRNLLVAPSSRRNLTVAVALLLLFSFRKGL